MKDHLSKAQRNYIRYRIRATEEGVARKYGISVAEVRQVRANAQPQHPARVAAIARRKRLSAGGLSAGGLSAGPPGATGVIVRAVVPATTAAAPKGQQLHVEGGVDLPVPLQ